MSKYLALCKLSKSDLIWIIDRLLDTGCWPTGDYYLDQALSDLKHEKDLADLRKADKYAEIAHKKRMEYCDLVKPYEGKSLIDIPLEVLKKVDLCMKEAQAADKKWNELMGIREENHGAEKENKA